LAQEGSKENLNIACWDKGLAEALEASEFNVFFQSSYLFTQASTIQNFSLETEPYPAEDYRVRP